MFVIDVLNRGTETEEFVFIHTQTKLLLDKYISVWSFKNAIQYTGLNILSYFGGDEFIDYLYLNANTELIPPVKLKVKKIQDLETEEANRNLIDRVVDFFEVTIPNAWDGFVSFVESIF